MEAQGAATSSVLLQCVCVFVMDRYHVLSGSRTVPALRPGLSREQAVVYLLALAKQKPVFLNSVAALMKVTDADANINKTLRAGLNRLLCSFLCWFWIFRICALFLKGLLPSCDVVCQFSH